MKKLLVKIVSLITATILSLGLFSGCDLVTTDVERDMDQIIAEVSIPDSGLTDTIYKRELASAFNSTGYYYVMYYGYGLSETYQMLLDDLIESRIIVQQSKMALTGTTASGGAANGKSFFEEASEVAEENKTSKDKVLTTPNYKGTKMTDLKKTDSLDLFLTEYEYVTAKYNLLVTVDSLLDSYKEAEEEKEYKNETISVTDRTTLTIPTDEEQNEVELKTKEVSNSYAKKMNKINKDNELGLTIFNADGEIAYDNVYALDMDVYKTYIEKFDISSKENKRAVKKLIKNLQQYGFISSEEAGRATPTKVDELLELTYFKDTAKSLYENLVVSKYKLALENQQEKLVNDKGTLYSEYVTLFKSQKELYENNYESYETALENAGESTFVVYNPNYDKGNYGYIANLLIGFSEQQKARLDAKTAESNITKPEIEAFRQGLVNELLVKDLRESWVLSNHGKYNPETGKFTFDGDYCPTEALREFNGTILGATPYQYLDENGEEATNYTYKSVSAGAVKYDDFYKGLFANVMGINDIKASGKIEGVELVNSVSKRINDETLKKFRDLIYAYSTDSGSLAENYGYVYSPITSGKVGPFNGKYVEEYAQASKRLIENGVGSYEMVVTEFGIHILLCTSVILPSGEEPVSSQAFEADLLVEGTLANMFKEYKLNLISSTQINSITDSFISQNRAKGVTLYEDRYSDLITGEEEDEHAGHNH